MGVMVLSLNSLGNLSRINLFHEICLCPVSVPLSYLETTESVVGYTDLCPQLLPFSTVSRFYRG
jgi:hypothetical protein